MSNQGKRKEQVEFSEKMVMFSMVGFMVCLFIALCMTILEWLI